MGQKGAIQTKMRGKPSENELKTTSNRRENAFFGIPDLKNLKWGSNLGGQIFDPIFDPSGAKYRGAGVGGGGGGYEAAEESGRE